MSNRLFSADKSKPWWYKVPKSLPWDPDDDSVGWRAWEKQTKKDYPVQFFFREIVWDWIISQRRKLKELKYHVRDFFFPRHAELRKAIPREWTDISTLVVDLNFAMILSFKQEADASLVDWDGTPDHRKFKNWLDAAAQWISQDRPNCIKQKEAAYPPHPLPKNMQGKSYDELYGEVNKLQKLIDDTDSSIIKQMVEYRDYMWT